MTALLDALASDPAEAASGVAAVRVGRVAVLTLNNPAALNAMSLGTWRRLGALFAELAGDGALRAVVIRGAGGKAFSAGADISEFSDKRMTAEAAFEYNRCIARALDGVIACPVPVVAMVAGLAVGGGCELAAACDVRIVSDDSRFGVPIGKLGVTLGHTEARALARLIGPGRLKELVFSGRLLDAAEASAAGLVERVVPRADLHDETAKLVESILAAAPTTVRSVKAVTEMVARELTPRDVEYLTGLTLTQYAGPELAEGVAAFLERRPPRFSGPNESGD